MAPVLLYMMNAELIVQLATVLHRAQVLTIEQGMVPPSEKLWAALDAAVAKRAKQMDAQGTANTWYACAKLQHRLPHAAEAALLRASAAVAPRMAPQAVSNTVWALATQYGLSHQIVEQDQNAYDAYEAPRAVLTLLTALEPSIAKQAARMSEQALTNTLWGFAKLHTTPALQAAQQALLQQLKELAPALEPAKVATALWAMSKLNMHASASLRAALRDAAVHHIPHMVGKDAGKTCKALWQLKWAGTDELVSMINRLNETPDALGGRAAKGVNGHARQAQAPEPLKSDDLASSNDAESVRSQDSRVIEPAAL